MITSKNFKDFAILKALLATYALKILETHCVNISCMTFHWVSMNILLTLERSERLQKCETGVVIQNKTVVVQVVVCLWEGNVDSVNVWSLVSKL